MVDSSGCPSRGQWTGRVSDVRSLSPRRDGSDRRGREHLGVVAGEDDGRSSRSAMVTGQATAALCGPHHATRPTMRAAAVMGLGR